MNRAFTVTLLGLALAASLLTSAVASAAPRGTLTAVEYTALSHGQRSLKRALSAKPPNWNAASTTCRRLGGATALLRTERTSCVAEVALLSSLTGFPKAFAACGSAQPAKYVCAEPLYRTLAREASGMYTKEAAVTRVAARRGFTGACLSYLGTSATGLRREKLFALATTKLYADMRAIVAVARGQQPSSAINLSQINKDVAAFEFDAGLVMAGGSSVQISDCAHA